MNEAETIIKILQSIGCKIYFDNNEISFSDKSLISETLLNKIHQHDKEIKEIINNDIQIMSIANKKNGAVGSELKKLLTDEWVSSSEIISRLDQMDARGYEWCENNILMIVRWFKKFADGHNIDFSIPKAKIILKKAISNAKKNLISF